MENLFSEGMQMYDKFLIGPYNKGIKNDTPPWATPEDAFSYAHNAFAWRGTMRKRWGSMVMDTNKAEDVQQYFSRLKIQHSAVTDPSGHAFGTWDGTIFNIGQMMLLENGTTYVPFYITAPGLSDMMCNTINYRININATDALGNCFGIAPTTGHFGQSIHVGDTIFTIISAVPGPQAMGVSVDGTGTATFDVTTGAYVITASELNTNVYWNPYFGRFDLTPGATLGDFVINGLPGMRVWFFPTLPVIGFATYEHALTNDNDTFAFDRQFSYIYDPILGWDRLGTMTWTGLDTDYYSWTNWYDTGINNDTLYVTNNKDTDHIQWYRGAWNTLHPIINAGGDHLDTCRILLVYKGRLFALNTVEAGQTYTTRIRWSWFGDPTDVDAWRTDLKKTAGYLDLPTKQPIVSASILNDRILIYCTHSTWEVVYANNDIAPFIPHSINTELGAHSQFSMVFLDKNCIGIGSTGIHACNGNVVERIDNDIPDMIYEMFNEEDQISHVYGIRDFQMEMIYWAVNKDNGAVPNGQKYPNQVLVYNYKNGAWSIFDDNITCFGHWEKQGNRTWSSMTETWETCNARWYDPMLQKHPKMVIVGNQQGWTFLVNPSITRNSKSLSIHTLDSTTRLITSINHNIRGSSFVYINNCMGITDINDQIWNVTPIDKDTLRIYPKDGKPALMGDYLGGGTMELVSVMEFGTKPFNFYIKDNRGIAIQKISCLVQQNPNAYVKVGCSPSYSFVNVIPDGLVNGSQYGTSQIALFSDETGYIPETQDSLWRTAYINIQGSALSIVMYYSIDEIMDKNSAFGGFTLQAMAIYAMPTTYNPTD